MSACLRAPRVVRRVELYLPVFNAKIADKYPVAVPYAMQPLGDKGALTTKSAMADYAHHGERDLPLLLPARIPHRS